MVSVQIQSRGVKDRRVLEAMERVPRERFVPLREQAEAYADHPVPIGCGQTISQPFIVALMVAELRTRPGSRLLEVGTGCGYVAAVLAEMGCEVYTMDIVASLAIEATARLRELGYRNVHTRCGDGWKGWAEAAPFDGIIVSAAPPSVPPALLEQLAEGGRLIIPVGEDHQELWAYQRTPGGFQGEELCEVRFVPMIAAR